MEQAGRGTGPPWGLESLGKLLWWLLIPRLGCPRLRVAGLPKSPALPSPSTVVLPAGLLQALLHQELLPHGGAGPLQLQFTSHRDQWVLGNWGHIAEGGSRGQGLPLLSRSLPHDHLH